MTVPENCPLCPASGKVKIVAETPDAYLSEAIDTEIEGCYLIVPKSHITDVMMLPGRWHVSLRNLLNQVPWYRRSSSYSLDFSSGEAAGRRLSHVYFWVIPRDEKSSARSHGKNTAKLLEELNRPTPAAT